MALFRPKPDLHRTMRSAELICIATVIAGCAFKIMHWPGAAVLIILGGSSLALFYFPFGYRTLPAPKQTDQLPWLTWLAGAAHGDGGAGVLHAALAQQRAVDARRGDRLRNSDPCCRCGAVQASALRHVLRWPAGALCAPRPARVVHPGYFSGTTAVMRRIAGGVAPKTM